MTLFERSLDGVPRAELERRLAEATKEVAALREQLEVERGTYADAYGTLRTAAVAESGEPIVQAILRLRAIADVFPHWRCPNCQAFNGEAKERLEQCRACGTRRPAP